jgi:hypothetical protein
MVGSMARKTFSVRFGVRAEDGRRSSIWSLWVYDREKVRRPKSDIYLTNEVMKGLMKVSLHESGQWQMSLNKEFDDALREKGTLLGDSRHIARWDRPPAQHPGTLTAIRLVFPTAELEALTSLADKKDKTIWIPAAPKSEAVVFLLVITTWATTEATLPDWPAREGSGSALLTRMPLCSGETLWVVYRNQPILKEVEKMINGLQEKAKADVAQQEEWWDEGLGRFMVGAIQKDGSWAFFDVAEPKRAEP